MSEHLTQLLAHPTVEFRTWDDPAAHDGFPADSDDTLVWLTPTIGATGVLILHRLSRYLSEPADHTYDLVELGGCFGLWNQGHTTVSPHFLRSIRRLEQFGMIRPIGGWIEVRTMIPKLATRTINRMPAALAANCPYRA